MASWPEMPAWNHDGAKLADWRKRLVLIRKRPASDKALQRTAAALRFLRHSRLAGCAWLCGGRR